MGGFFAGSRPRSPAPRGSLNDVRPRSALTVAALWVALAWVVACGGSQAREAPATETPTPAALVAPTVTPGASTPVITAEPTPASAPTVPVPTSTPAPPPASPATAAPATPVSPAPPPPQALIVVAESATFVPASLMADAGAITLTLDNRDAGVRHDLQLYGPDNAPFGSTPVIVGPAVASLTIDAAPGSYRFVCTVHPLQMRGVLVVE